VPKARIVFEKPVELGLFPKHSISIVTPNILELKAMYEAADELGFFAGSGWWRILDGFSITSQCRQGKPVFSSHSDGLLNVDIEMLQQKIKRADPTADTTSSIIEVAKSVVMGEERPLTDFVVEGSVQQAISLLPYIPNILIKLGPRGVLCVRLSPKGVEEKDDCLTLRLKRSAVDVVVRYFPGLQHQGIASVTGAGYGSI
jgi:hypothetical protein